MRLPLRSLWWVFQYFSTWDTCLIFYSLKPCCSRSLYDQRLFSCQMETSRASAFYSVHLHFFQQIQLVTLATFSLYGCLGDCYLNKEHSFFLLLLLKRKKKKGFHKSGRGRKKIKLKQHNYISFSSILSTRWEGKLQRKPPLLLGVTSGERDAWNSNSGRARDMPVWGTHSFQMGFEQGHMFSVVISNDSAWAVRL